MLVMSASMVTASPASASPTGVPEYYQFCYDHPPLGAVDGYNTVYKTAVRSAAGVECQHYVGYEGWFLLWTWKTYYSWTDVCLAMGMATPGWYDSRGYPRCG